MRRLVLLVSALVFVDTMLFAALTPLLGHFEHDLHLSSATAGLLVAAYAAGALVGGLPGGVAAAKMGPRRAVLTGLALMAAASLGFAFSNSLAALSVTRFLQGLGSAFTWAGAFSWLIAAAPRERRGTLIGTAMGAAVFGALFGPVVGALAAETGPRRGLLRRLGARRDSRRDDADDPLARARTAVAGRAAQRRVERPLPLAGSACWRSARCWRGFCRCWLRSTSPTRAGARRRSARSGWSPPRSRPWSRR